MAMAEIPDRLTETEKIADTRQVREADQSHSHKCLISSKSFVKKPRENFTNNQGKQQCRALCSYSEVLSRDPRT